MGVGGGREVEVGRVDKSQMAKFKVMIFLLNPKPLKRPSWPLGQSSDSFLIYQFKR